MDVTGTAAVVTGGASGLGRATAIKLVEAGAKVALLDRNLDLAEKTALEIGALAVECDVSSEGSAEAAFATACFVGYAVKGPVHRALAELDLARDPDPVVHDVRTVGFLRALDLDPVDALGAAVVARADRRLAAPPAPTEHPIVRRARAIRDRVAPAATAPATA